MGESVITKIGKKKLCMAHAGDIALPKIEKMGFGNGGTDENGEVIKATGNEEALKSELIKKDIISHEYIGETQCKYKARLTKTELINEKINEMGLFDTEGDLVAYSSFLDKKKDDNFEFEFTMNEVFL